MNGILYHSFSARTRVGQLLLAALVWLQLSTSLLAEQHYLSSGHPDGIALLGPPPVAGSDEAVADLASARAVFKARTPAEEERAKKDGTLSFKLFAPAIGPVFDLEKLPKTDGFLKKVREDIREPINLPKDHWKRLRPYALDPELNLGKPEPSFSYPSGHATAGMVYALVLSELFPEKRDALVAIGRDIGWDRVLIGKHFPSDVRAGRVLAYALVRELDASPAFQADLAAAKAEIAAAMTHESGVVTK